MYEGGETPMDKLVRLTWDGAAWRYPEGVPEDIANTIRHEFELIRNKKIAPYFLTVHEIVTQARKMGILCQGRGSAANSAVCYCLGVTSVNPKEVKVLFERFLSNERDEPPDIDVDFEHERREEIIQWIYNEKSRTSRRTRRHGDRLQEPQRHPRGRQGARPVARHGGRHGRHRMGHGLGRRR